MNFPMMIKYSDKVAGGDSLFFRIRINPKHIEDEGLRLHEIEHVRQWYWITLFSLFSYSLIFVIATFFTSLILIDLGMYALILMGSFMTQKLLYGISKQYRLWSEANAYARQIETYPDEHIEHYMREYSKILALDYDLDISAEEARASIEQYK